MRPEKAGVWPERTAPFPAYRQPFNARWSSYHLLKPIAH